MKGIPPEIDALMWRLAEEGGPVAQEEFEQRHVRYAPELSRRIRMVSELRAAGKTTHRRPTFTPRPVRVATTPRWAVGMVAGVAALAVGAVAYVAASGGERPPSPAPKVVENPPNKAPVVPPVRTPKPEIAPKPPTSGVVVDDPAPKVEAPPALNKRPKYLDPLEVHISDTDLTKAIQIVAMSGGLKVTVAPGFEDKKVSLDYDGNLNAIETLSAMASEYGFSVLEEGEGDFLVVPVREANDGARRVGP